LNLRSALQQVAFRCSQDLRENVYLRTALDVTRPQAVRGLITHRCNFHCQYCGYAGNHDPGNEMDTAQWRAALESLRRFLGRYTIQISGGEPLLRRDLLELVAFCHDRGIGWGLITNGSLIDHERAEAIVRARPVNIDISVDGATVATHDDIRGFPGALDRITRAIDVLTSARERKRCSFPIRIKATVHRRNLRHLPDLVRWVQAVGATTIDFQPVRPWTATAGTELWLRDESDWRELNRVTEDLVALRRAGAPIET
jgi:MoaA/NifB/PqqE/SkfB family radical SAM enzyme